MNYSSYIAPDAPLDVVSLLKNGRNVNLNLTREHVNHIVSGICPQRESGNDNMENKSDPTSFDSSALYIANQLEKGYFDDFLQSAYYAKYQVGVLKFAENAKNT